MTEYDMSSTVTTPAFIKCVETYEHKLTAAVDMGTAKKRLKRRTKMTS